MRSWWEADPAVLASELKSLTTAGYVLVHQGVGRGHGLRLEVKRARRRYQLVFDENYRYGGYVVAREMLHRGTELKAGDRLGLGLGPNGALSALSRIRDRVFDLPTTAYQGRALLPSVWGHRPMTGHGTIQFAVSAGGSSMVPLTITGVTESVAAEFAAASARYRRAFPRRLEGVWAAGSREQSSVVSPAKVERQLAAAHGIDLDVLRLRLRVEVGALCVPSAYASTWHFVYRSTSGELRQMETLACDDPYLYPERAPYARALASAHVALVGCGAVGWPVAVMLARSGVRRLTLFDDDKIQPHNLARLGAFITDTGTYKVQTLAAQLEAIAPGIEVDQFTVDVGQNVGAAALADARPNLLINLTAEERSTDETNLAALHLGVPALFAWVSHGVVAARIFRVRPFESACYECLRESAPAPIRSHVRFFPGEFRAWTGSIVDVEAFAAVVAQTAIRTLRRLPASHWNPDHVLLDFGGLAPRARRVEIARDPSCRVCRS